MAQRERIVAPPMVYVQGEEMSAYCMRLILDKWIHPHIDTKAWEVYDLSCSNRDATSDTVLKDAVSAGKRIRSIFKEPTVTPSHEQQIRMKLANPLPSPNGVMRQGWNGVAISRDTIQVDGLQLGFRKKVLFDRHAVGGEYGASFEIVGAGRVETIFTAADGSRRVIGSRTLTDEANAVVTYHNPLDNLSELGHIFFSRCLEQQATPYVVTKRTVFKWQDSFWLALKAVFDEHYKQHFLAQGLLHRSNGELQHLLSDSAAMQAIRWSDGGFGMVAHNYDGDVLSDEIAQLHGGPAFMTSVLVGSTAEGQQIRQFEASHGTGADLWAQHLGGAETSFNPLGLAEALLAAIAFSAHTHATGAEAGSAEAEAKERLLAWTDSLRAALHRQLARRGTRDVAGPSGVCTEALVEAVAADLHATSMAQT